jgi:LytR cell envelope-related transcriptional attenuator
MVLLIAAIPVLATLGYRTLRDTTTGRRIDAQNDPNKTRYEANVLPTPVMLLVEMGADNSLQGLTMLTLGPGDTGGAVVFIPPDTVAQRADGTLDTLSNTFGKGDVAALEQATANLLKLSFDQVKIMDADQWQQFAAPVAPLSVDNPDRVVIGDARGRTATLFPAGPLQLRGDQIVSYMQVRNPNESELAQLNRKQALWSAWLAAIKASNSPGAVPGETTSGFGRYLVGLSKGPSDITMLPVKAQAPGANNGLFVAEPAAVQALIARDVPLPTPANVGDRVRVRLLSGTGPIGSPNAVASEIVSAGGEITIIGNADRFDYTTTQIIYNGDQFAAAAQKLRDALGVGEVSKSPTPNDIEDVTVILGQDATAKYGGNGG